MMPELREMSTEKSDVELLGFGHEGNLFLINLDL
jgi:hypothetical protein